jgi:restriction endonuclease
LADDLRTAERMKIECATKHFDAIAGGDNPARYRVVASLAELTL